jgi:hypothetical protein
MLGDPSTGGELRWLADENFNNDIVRALFRHKPDIDLDSLATIRLWRDCV